MVEVTKTQQETVLPAYQEKFLKDLLKQQRQLLERDKQSQNTRITLLLYLQNN